MTGAYLRVCRDDKYEAIEVEHLTEEERSELFKHRPTSELLRWINMLCATLRDLEPNPDRFLCDITAPATVECTIRNDGTVVWINVDGICRFRACRIGTLVVHDERPKP